MKSGTAPGYDHIQPEFIKILGPNSVRWLSAKLSQLTQFQRYGERLK